MSAVFVVTEGEYDDYRILGVFTHREQAEKYCCPTGCIAKREPWPSGQERSCRIEPWELNQGKTDKRGDY